MKLWMMFYFIRKENKEKDRRELEVLALINNLTNSNWAPTHHQHHPLGTKWKSRNPILSADFGSQILIFCFLRKFNIYLIFYLLIWFTKILISISTVALPINYLLCLRLLQGAFSLLRWSLERDQGLENWSALLPL